MGRGKPVEIDTRTFETQGAAQQYFKEMLNRYRPGDRVAEVDAYDLQALLVRHTEFPQKVGCGVSHFEVMMTEHGTQCFRIVRVDGTGTDFSLKNCITQKTPTKKQEVCQALRRVVRFDLYNARDSFFAKHADSDGKVPCAVTGELVSREQAHMDHCPPMTFEVIVNTFLCGQGLRYEDVPITTAQDEQVSPELTDEALGETFRAYHKSMATLDYVKDKVNLSQASKNRVKSTRIDLAKG